MFLIFSDAGAWDVSGFTPEKIERIAALSLDNGYPCKFVKEMPADFLRVHRSEPTVEWVTAVPQRFLEL